MEYLKAWLFKEKKLAELGKKEHTEDERLLLKYLEQMITQMQGLLDTKLVRRTKVGNLELAELADYQTQVRILKDQLVDAESVIAHLEMFFAQYKEGEKISAKINMMPRLYFKTKRERENENKSN